MPFPDLTALPRVKVIHPNLALEAGHETRIILIDGRTGHFQDILLSTASSGVTVTHFVLFGERDAAVVVSGTADTIKSLVGRFGTTAFEKPLPLTVRATLIHEGVRVPNLGKDRPDAEDWLTLEALRVDPTAEPPDDFLERAESSSWIIGEAFDSGRPPFLSHGIHALVGLQSREGVHPSPIPI